MNTTRNVRSAITAVSALLLGCTGLASTAVACPPLTAMLITAKENHLSLNDNAPVCVPLNEDGTVDYTFQLKVVPQANPPVAVSVEQKGSATVTIEGNNADDPAKVSVHVHGPAALGDEFSYIIYAEGIGMLDPKVRVIPSDQNMTHQAGVLQDYLETYGLTTEDVPGLLRTIDEMSAENKTN